MKLNLTLLRKLKGMLNVKHFPIFDTEAALEHYKSEVAKYVCTTELKPYGVPADVFYRPTPHPVYGNRYFGLYRDTITNYVYICNADAVENLNFCVIDNGKGEWTYSQDTHDFLSWGENYIDGGRAYTRVGGNPLPKVISLRVVDGEFKGVKDG